jgi:hypothetical protein
MLSLPSLFLFSTNIPILNLKMNDNDELVEIEKKVNKSEDKKICYSLHTIHSYEQKCETKVSVDYVNIHTHTHLDEKKAIVYDGSKHLIVEHHAKSIDHPNVCVCVYMSNNPRRSFIYFSCTFL